MEIQQLIIKQMHRGQARVSYPSQKGTAISKHIEFKLLQSSGNNHHSQLDQHLLKTASILNTPSTTIDLRQFKSCELNKDSRQTAAPVMRSLRLGGKDRGCESATKILTLQQIKVEQGKTKQANQQPPHVSNSPSRKIFVSISKRNQHSQQKKKELDPQINILECCHIGEEQKRPKIKLNIYKDIARKNLQHHK